MRKHLISILLLSTLIAFSFVTSTTTAQQKDKKNTAASQTTVAPPALKRTTSRHETRRFGYGSTLTITGAPAGSITIEGWNKSEIDITAEIELNADTEADLATLAALNNFKLDEDANHLRLVTTGTHDKKFMNRAAKNFPKKLLGLPWKIDYRIRLPFSTDLEIDAGRGAINLASVEGAIRLTALEADARFLLTGGLFIATIGRGRVEVTLGARSWRGAGADIRLASGELTLELPPGASADINADILRTGQIESTYTGLQPIERTTPTPRSIKARAGAGGPTLAFTVGDGTLRIKQKTETTPE
jgi:hypothetical protein